MHGCMDALIHTSSPPGHTQNTTRGQSNRPQNPSSGPRWCKANLGRPLQLGHEIAKGSSSRGLRTGSSELILQMYSTVFLPTTLLLDCLRFCHITSLHPSIMKPDQEKRAIIRDLDPSHGHVYQERRKCPSTPSRRRIAFPPPLPCRAHGKWRRAMALTGVKPFEDDDMQPLCLVGTAWDVGGIILLHHPPTLDWRLETGDWNLQSMTVCMAILNFQSAS